MPDEYNFSSYSEDERGLIEEIERLRQRVKDLETEKMDKTFTYDPLHKVHTQEHHVCVTNGEALQQLFRELEAYLRGDHPGYIPRLDITYKTWRQEESLSRRHIK